MTSQENHLGYRPDIDGLRAIAVIAVIVFHSFPSVFPGGFTGVDIFFVISGFLITSIIALNLNAGIFRLSNFYSKRIKRIFPSLIVVLLAVMIMGWADLLPVDFIQLGKHIAAGAGFSSNLILWSESGYFDHSSDVKPLLHLWSLGIEEQFYLVWPIALMVSHRFKMRSFWISILIGISSFCFCTVLKRHYPTAAFYSPISRFWEFNIGATFALAGSVESSSNQRLHALIANRTIRNIASVLGFILLLSSLLFIKQSESFVGKAALLPTTGALLLIYAGRESWINQFLLQNRLLVGIGLISYPLYLWHWIFLSFLNIDSVLFSNHGMINARIISILLSLALSYLTFRYVEKPIRPSKRPRTVYLLIAAMTTVGLSGYSVFLLSGFPRRFPAAIRGLVSPIDFKFEEQARFGKCHFDSRFPKNNVQVGSPECAETSRPTVLLWGDSYAASLYPGLLDLKKGHSFGIIQTTSCGTPPLLNINFDNSCVNANDMNKWNENVLGLIQSKAPNIIILNGYWAAYGAGKDLLSKISLVITRIKKISPKSRIVIIGAAPTWGGWEDGLPREMYRYWKTNPSHPLPPEYMKYGLVNDFDDHFFSEEVPKLGASYISIHEALCKDEGCLTRVGPELTDLTAIDQGHLSPSGSRYLLNKVKDEIFK
jgi:peptidoglycan/LPS O-acetylase OafA/YrhL